MKPKHTFTGFIDLAKKHKQTFDGHVAELKKCIELARQAMPSQKLFFRRETALMIFEMLDELSKCARGKHEPCGDVLVSIEDDGVIESEAWTHLFPVGETQGQPGTLSVCKRCRCVYWGETV